MTDDLGEDNWWMAGKNAEVSDSKGEVDSDGQANSKARRRKLSIDNEEKSKKKKIKVDKMLDDVQIKSEGIKKGTIADIDALPTNAEVAGKKVSKKKLRQKEEKLGKENYSKSDSGFLKLDVSVEKKKKKKSKDEKNSSNNKEEEAKTNTEQPVNEGNKKKKKKRNRLTEELLNKPDMPLVPHDLTSNITKFYSGELSCVEMDELQLDERHFTICNDLTHTVQSYLKSVVPKWKKILSDVTDISHGMPLVIIVCASGIRAVDLIRSLADFKMKDFFIAKLFSKHLKMKDQIKFLKSHRTHIGVGTPKRLEELVLGGHLNLTQTKYVIFDWSWRDAKLSRLIDKAQLRENVMSLLKTCIIPRARNETLKIGLF